MAPVVYRVCSVALEAVDGGDDPGDADPANRQRFVKIEPFGCG